MVRNVNVSLPFYRWSIDAGREVSKNLISRWYKGFDQFSRNCTYVLHFTFYRSVILHGALCPDIIAPQSALFVV